MLSLAVVSLLAISSDVAAAQQHLAAGKLDEVLFDLNGKKLEGNDASSAAGVLASAAQKSQDDWALCLQFTQMALRFDPKQPLALEVGSRAAFANKDFDLAESFADRWKALGDPRGALLRAEIAVAEGEWRKALDALPPAASLPVNERARAEGVRQRAQSELGERQVGLSTARDLDRKLAIAMEAAAKASGTMHGMSREKSNRVVLYSTSWCGYCKKAAQWMKKNGVDFEEKDIERDSDAAKELAEKAREANVRVNGVPVIDAKGTLVNGFDELRLRELLL